MAGLVEKEVNFKSWKVPELKKYLQVRGISVSNKTKKEELVELREKAHELALELTDDGEFISDVVNGSWRCFISFRWRCLGKSNIVGTGFAFVGPNPPSKCLEHIRVCFVTFRLSSRHAAIHLRRLSCSRIPRAYCFFLVI